MILKTIKALWWLFVIRLLSSCIWGGEPDNIYFDWKGLEVRNVNSQGLYVQDMDRDTMLRSAISFRVNLLPEQDVYLRSESATVGFADANALSIEPLYIPNQDIDSFVVHTLWDINQNYRAHMDVSELFVSEDQSGAYYQLYDELVSEDNPQILIHFMPRIADLDSVCFEVSALLSDGRWLRDTTSVITLIDAL